MERTNELFIQELLDYYEIRHSDFIGYNYKIDAPVTALELVHEFIHLTHQEQNEVFCEVMQVYKKVSKMEMLNRLLDVYFNITDYKRGKNNDQ